MKTTTKNALVLLAAGVSSRMENLGKKEFLELDGGTVLSRAAASFLQTDAFFAIAVSYQKGFLSKTKAAFFSLPQVRNRFFANDCVSNGEKKIPFQPCLIFVQGGSSRQESVFNALSALKKKCGKIQTVLIHDGARPFVSSELVKKILFAAKKSNAAAPALEPVETQKEIECIVPKKLGKKNQENSICEKKIIRHLARNKLASIQTPQGFDFEKIFLFHKAAKKDGFFCTDDTEIWDHYSKEKTRVVQGESQNIKITYPKDFFAGRAIQKEFRVGLGSDLHRLEYGLPLFLGGIKIPSKKGAVAHSDGDVLLHAIIDAILGAAALGDIGEFFPCGDAKWQGADSKMLLALAWQCAKEQGWSLENLDCVVKLQEPKFLPYRKKVREKIAKILNCCTERIFVKAKTGEGVDAVGEGLCVECEAICLLSRNL